MLPTKFRIICSSGFRGENLQKSTNQKQELPVVAIFVNMDRDEMSNLYRGPPIDASYQVSVHLVKRFQRRKIKKISQWPCLLADRDGMSKFYRGPSIDASYQVSDHLTKRFQSRRFLEIDQSETRISCGGHVC